MTNDVWGRECSNGHPVPEADGAFCGQCGAPIAAAPPPSAPSPGPAPTPETSHGSSRKALWISLAAVVAVIVLVGIGAIIRASDHHSPTPATTSASNSPAPTIAMFDPAAPQASVVASIENDFCTGTPNVFTIADQTSVNCNGSDSSPLGMALFKVFSSPDAFQAELASGALACTPGEVLVYGPAWEVSLNSSTEAAALIQQGGTSGTCNSNN